MNIVDTLLLIECMILAIDELLLMICIMQNMLLLIVLPWCWVNELLKAYANDVVVDCCTAEYVSRVHGVTYVSISEGGCSLGLNGK